MLPTPALARTVSIRRAEPRPIFDGIVIAIPATLASIADARCATSGTLTMTWLSEIGSEFPARKMIAAAQVTSGCDLQVRVNDYLGALCVAHFGKGLMPRGSRRRRQSTGQ